MRIRKYALRDTHLGINIRSDVAELSQRKGTLMRSPLRSLFALLLPLLVVVFVPIASQAAGKKKPINFVFLLVDDLGWADVGCNGSKFYETPNIDKLAASGMRFTNGYTASPVCSPTRASIMSGKHPVRVNITDWIPGQRGRPNNKLLMPEDRSNLALSEVTIAEALKMAGYQTFFAGKWHLGSKGHWPTDQGFDTNIGGWEAGSPKRGGYYSPWTNPNLKSKKKGEYLTERLTKESLNFLEKRDKKKPFLLYLAYYNVHTPIQPYKKRVGHFQEKANKLFKNKTPFKKEHEGFSRLRQDHPPYASMVKAVDDSVGQILAKLKALDLDENTVVIFFSDNGGLCTTGRRGGPTCNLPLRSGKGWLYEGGIRVPMIIRAPGTTMPGSTCHYPAVSMDFYPTMLELAGLKARPKQHVDGVSLVPLLKGQKKLKRQTLYWHYPHYHGSTWKPGSSIRDGDWVLIRFDHYKTAELYNLKNDIGQKNDLAKKMPEKTAELLKKLATWQKDIGAKLPRPNPNYDPTRKNPKKNKKGKKQKAKRVQTVKGEWKKHVIHKGLHTNTAVAGDFTGDGLPDVIACSGNKTRLFVAPKWEEVVLAVHPKKNFIHSEVFDVDGDGDLDYIGAHYKPGWVVWLECPKRPLKDRWRLHIVDNKINGIHGLLKGDVDKDGKIDLLANSAQPVGMFPNSAVWLRVPKKPHDADHWERHVFANKDAPGLSHYLGFDDVNKDGRPDIAMAAKGGKQAKPGTGDWFAWWEAPKDPTKVWRKHLIAKNQPGATNIQQADVNGDGQMDFIATRGHGKGVIWFEGPTWKVHTIHKTLLYPHCLQVVDMDGDGDIDAATCAYGDKIAAWFENNGKGNFTTHIVARNQAAYDIRAVDMDRDGDLDLLIAGQQSNNVVWYENPRKSKIK